MAFTWLVALILLVDALNIKSDFNYRGLCILYVAGYIVSVVVNVLTDRLTEMRRE
jgi:hypothetical protein